MFDPSAALPVIDRLWWYLSLGATGILTEEATPLIGGLVAHDGHIRLVTAGCASRLGTWMAGAALYWLARWLGRWRRVWVPGGVAQTRRVMLRALQVVRRHPWRSSPVGPLSYGLLGAL